jgi:hypothetical protein
MQKPLEGPSTNLVACWVLSIQYEIMIAMEYSLADFEYRVVNGWVA